MMIYIIEMYYVRRMDSFCGIHYIIYFFFLFKMIIITDTRNKRINHKLFYCFVLKIIRLGEKRFSQFCTCSCIYFFLFRFSSLAFVNYLRFSFEWIFHATKDFLFFYSFSCIMLEIIFEVILYWNPNKFSPFSQYLNVEFWWKVRSFLSWTSFWLVKNNHTWNQYAYMNVHVLVI